MHKNYGNHARFHVPVGLIIEMRKIPIYLVMLLAVCIGCSKRSSFAPSDPYDYQGSVTSPDGPDFASAFTMVATIKKDASGSVYLWSKGMRFNPVDDIDFVRQQRVVANVSFSPSSDTEFDAKVHWIETLDEGIFTSDASVTGDDPLKVNFESWMTCVDDGYLTINYSTWWGEHPVHHDFYLVSGLDASDPYSLELRHNANCDARGEFAEGVVCFDINSLPDTGDAPKMITIKWKDTETKTSIAKFEFTSRK